MGRLAGKVALISGGARGLGAASARLMVEEGANVVVGDVLEELAGALAEDLGPAAHAVHLDVRDEQSWASAVAKVGDTYGRLDVLVNNAGIQRNVSLEDVTLAEYLEVVQVNQVGCFLGMRSVIPLMRAGGGGSIVNVSSMAGMQGLRGQTAYGSTKWAIRGMTKIAAIELGPSGIRVNSVHPGPIDTDMAPDSAAKRSAAAALPLGRSASPEEVARLIVYLASDDSGFSTGSEFIVDGGFTAGTLLVQVPST